MKNIDSLKNSLQFRQIYRKHDSIADRYLIVYKADGTGKVGIVCSKKVGNSVVRHRITRLIREAYRLNRENISQDKDIIIIAREMAKGQGFTVIESSFINLMKRHSIYEMKN